jgi:DNA-binding CsgD family transcriptional regulator
MQQDLTEVVGLIYDVSVAPERWPDLMRCLGRALRCPNVAVVRSSRDRSRFVGEAVGIDREEYQTFLRRFHRRGPLRRLAPPRYTGQIVELREIMPRTAFERTEVYQDYFRPNDLGEGVRLTLWHGETDTETVSLLRSHRLGPMEADEMAFVRSLMPHLQRTALVARRLRGAELAARSAQAALGGLAQPVLLLDEAGRLAHANPAAEALLREADGLAARDRRLRAASPAAERQLQALVAAATARPGTAGTLRLARPSGALPLALVAMPLRLEEIVSGTGLAAVLCVSDPAARGCASAPLLTDLFGLTSAEAALAAELLAGRELRDIAHGTGRTINTLRTHLAHLMAKTETRRQSDLVRVLERLSALPARLSA